MTERHEDPDGDSTPPHLPKIERFTIREQIAEGGMGVVYLADQEHPRRVVALKLIRPGLFREEVLKRFQFEAELLARVLHPGIAGIYEAGEAETDAGRQPYIALEYVEGLPVTEYAEAKSLSAAARLDLLARICDAVHHAHQKGIVHRDLKPGNILVVESEDDRGNGATPISQSAEPVGQPKVLDFGVSRLVQEQGVENERITQTGFLVGTLAYMSPEQASGGQDVDTRSDVYSLGVIGFELLSGRLPHEVRDLPLLQALRTIQEKAVPRLDSVDRRFRGDVSIIIGKALESEIEQRYGSAAALADDLRRYLSHQPIGARPPTFTYQLGRFVRRHKALVASLLIAFLCLVTGLVASVISQREAAAQRDVAERRKDEALLSEYAALIQAAAAYASVGDEAAARQRLEASPPEHRGWEWDYVNSRLESELSHVPMDIQARPRPFVTADDRHALFVVESTKPGPHRVLRRMDLTDGSWTDHPIVPEGIRALVLRTDLRTVLVAEKDRRIVSLDFGGERESHAVFEHEGYVTTMAPTRDGKRLLVGLGLSGKPPKYELLVLDMESFEVLHRRSVPQRIAGLDASPDGSLLALAGSRGALLLLDLENGGPPRSLPGHVGTVDQVRFSPGGRRLASSDMVQSIRVWDVETGRPEHMLGPIQHTTRTLRFNPDEGTLVSGHADGRIRHWSVDTGQLLRTTSGPTPEGDSDRDTLALGFSGEGGVLRSIGRDGVHEFTAREPVSAVCEHGRTHDPYVYGVTFSPSGRHLLSAGWDGRIRVWDTETRRPVTVLDCPQAGYWSRYSRDGRRLLVGSQHSRHVKIVSLRDAVTFETLNELRGQTYLALGEFVPRADTVLLGISSELWLADPETLAVREKRPTPGVMSAMDESPDGTRIACGTESGVVQILDASTFEVLLEFRAHESATDALAFSPDGSRLVTGGDRQHVKVWDVRTGERLVSFTSPASREFFSFVFSPDGKRLYIGSRHPDIRVCDAETGRELLQLKGHRSYVHELALSPDGRVLASASGDNTVRFWDSRPLAERIDKRDRALAAERAVSNDVERMFRSLPDRPAVLRAIEAEPGFDALHRHAARNVALRRGK